MKFVKSAALVLGLLFVASASSQAQDTAAADRGGLRPIAEGRFPDTRGIAAGIIIIGAAMGIGMIAKGAVESMARQPEVARQINTSMIIAAALIEGVTFFALIIVLRLHHRQTVDSADRLGPRPTHRPGRSAPAPPDTRSPRVLRIARLTHPCSGDRSRPSGSLALA